MRVIDNVLRDNTIKFEYKKQTVNMRIRDALYALSPSLSPNWFPSDAKYGVCNTKDLPRDLSKQLSLDLARELINATPDEISRLTKEKILRIFRGEVSTLQDLLLD